MPRIVRVAVRGKDHLLASSRQLEVFVESARDGLKMFVAQLLKTTFGSTGKGEPATPSQAGESK